MPNVENMNRDHEYSIGGLEAGAHDVNVLPHMHDERGVARLFPMAVAGTHTEEFPDVRPQDSEGLVAPDLLWLDHLQAARRLAARQSSGIRTREGDAAVMEETALSRLATSCSPSTPRTCPISMSPTSGAQA